LDFREPGAIGGHQSSSAGAFQSSAPGLVAPLPPLVAACGALAEPRRITLKGTDTVGGGSEALRLGPAQGAERRCGPSGAERDGGGSGSERWPPQAGSRPPSAPRRTWRRGRRAVGWVCKARAAPAALMPAPTATPLASHPPRGQAGLVQVSRRRATQGRGFTAAISSTASSGDSSGNNNRRVSRACTAG
jgi:hypothetical protein